jgi:hypothetical protein
MWWIASLLCPAWGTTFPPAPPLAEQLERAEAAGVYVVRSTRTVTLPDGFVATRAELEAVGEPVRGALRTATLGVPGGVVGGRYVDGFEGAPRVAAGDTLFLFLQPHDDRWILRDGFAAGLYRRLETSSGAYMVDGEGRAVTDVRCDARPVRGEGKPLSWDAAVAAFAKCGGAR